MQSTLFDTEIYPCVYFRKNGLSGTVSVFASGKLISLGTITIDEAFYDIQLVITKLREAELIQPTPIKPKIQNIVVKINFGYCIDLDHLKTNLSLEEYKPGGFGGIHWRPKNISGVILFFTSGKGIFNTKRMKNIETLKKFFNKKIQDGSIRRI